MASARSSSDWEEACCASRSLVRVSDWRARSRSASARATWAFSSASSTLKSGVPWRDERALPHQDLGDSALDVRAQLDRLHRLDLPGGEDGVHHGVGARDDHLDRHGRRAAAALRAAGLAGRLRLVAGADRERQPAPRRSAGSEAIETPCIGLTAHPCS